MQNCQYMWNVLAKSTMSSRWSKNIFFFQVYIQYTYGDIGFSDKLGLNKIRRSYWHFPSLQLTQWMANTTFLQVGLCGGKEKAFEQSNIKPWHFFVWTKLIHSTLFFACLISPLSNFVFVFHWCQNDFQSLQNSQFLRDCPVHRMTLCENRRCSRDFSHKTERLCVER